MAGKKSRKKQKSSESKPTFQQALKHYQSGLLLQAELTCNTILELQKDDSETLHLLGVIYTQNKNYRAAINVIAKAISINNSVSHYYGSLGNAFKELEEFDAAIKCYQQVLTLDPNSADAYYNLGIVLKKQGKFTEAITCYQRVLTLNSRYAPAYYNLGNVFYEQKKFTQALTCYQKALAINPNYVSVYYNSGVIFETQKNLAKAIECYQQVLAMDSNHVESLNNLGLCLSRQGKLSESITYYQRALKIDPKHIGVLNNLGYACKDKGLVDESIAYYKKVFEIQSNNVVSHSNFLLMLNYSPSYDGASLFKEHQKFNEQHALPLAESIKPHSNERDPDKRLKIGYMSQDFRKHSVAYFIEPILANHNHESFDIHCYYSLAQKDEVTERFEQYADKWVNIVELSDEEVAEQIREDEIDIMVDLMGHTGMNRILVFARKPAPISMTYLGYSNTTGLTAIDYHLSDNYVTPEENEAFNSEAIIRMPNSYFCYGSGDETKDVQVNSLPALQNDYVTFASFNVRAKLNPKVLKLWSKIFDAVPNARLFLKNKNYADIVNQSDNIEREKLFKAYFADLKIDFNRVIIEEFTPSMQKHLEMYHQVDIALDSFPYNGVTTTCEALWMGAPVVTLVGETHASRMGLSILSALGLKELIAYTPEEYVDICVKLANDLNYLEELRTKMREKMLSSSLMDGKTFARDLESHYRTLWQKWCNQG